MAAVQRPAIPAPRTFGRRPGRLLLVGAIALVVVTAAFQVNRFSRLTTTGYEINDLNRVRAEKQAANHELEAEVAQLSSLARVDWEARTRLHLQPAQRIMYTQVNHEVPDRQTLPTRFLPRERADISIEDEPLWRQLIRLLPFVD
jgi:cell division protein FtsL